MNFQVAVSIINLIRFEQEFQLERKIDFSLLESQYKHRPKKCKKFY
jgi:hypothetical protein